MGWAAPHIRRLAEGETVQFRPRGGSMAGKVPSGALVTVEPIGSRALHVGDVVLCKVRGQEYLHLIKAIGVGRYLIGNNVGGTNGWTSRANIFGICIHVEA